MPYLKCIESNMRIFVIQLFLNGPDRILGSARVNIDCLYEKQVKVVTEDTSNIYIFKKSNL